MDQKFEDSGKLFLLGQLYHADKAWDEAEYYYKNSLRFDPIYKPAQAAMIKLMLDRGEPARAQQYLDTYMKQVANSPDKLIELGVEFQQQKLDPYALDCFQKVIELVPNSPEGYKYMGYFYLNKNDKDKATEYFKKSFNLDRLQDDVAFELGKLNVPIVYPGNPGKIAPSEE